jgi:hypothetical protein
MGMAIVIKNIPNNLIRSSQGEDNGPMRLLLFFLFFGVKRGKYK